MFRELLAEDKTRGFVIRRKVEEYLSQAKLLLFLVIVYFEESPITQRNDSV
jgi:hypothetical protein